MQHLGRIALGEVTVTRVVEIEPHFYVPTFLLPEATPERLAPYRERLAPHFFDLASDRLIAAVHAFLVRTPLTTVLVDGCFGNDKDRPAKYPHARLRQGAFLADIAGAGCPAEAIDYVLCTHLHLDHVGWNTRLVDGRWVPTFPNARYLFSPVELAYAEAEARDRPEADLGCWADSIAPVLASGQAMTIEPPHAIDHWLTVEPWPGHSPGHVVLRIAAGGREAAICGDVLHHPVQYFEPGWNSGFCHDPAGARASRRRFIEGCVERGTVVLPGHFATPTAGLVERSGAAWRWRGLDE